MLEKRQIAENWLPRYTGMPLVKFGSHILLTNFGNYVEWLAVVYAITNISCPAISIPAGFTADRLPVGIQLVAPPRAEGRLLAGARLLEQILGVALDRPIDPKPGS